MKKICVITGTRAEYGLLYPLMKRIYEDNELDLHIVATGSHLSREFGLTYKAIEDDGFIIDKKIDILLSSDTRNAVSKSMGLAMIGFGDYFEEHHPDMVVVLGDRYEIFAAVSAAIVALIPVAHIHGGEITEGAYDDYFRHCITKMSSLHFTSCAQHRKRVIQMGENPDNVFDVGAIGIENIRNLELMSKYELEQSINFKLDREFGIVTFHPVTLEQNCTVKQTKALLKALEDTKDMKFIITKANADNEGREINALIDEFVEKHMDRFICFASLGMLRYLSAMNYAAMVIGNSSSGIIEAPAFHIPTIDIGNRQKGRLCASSVLHCHPEVDSIKHAIATVRTKEFRELSALAVNPYGDGEVSIKILNIVKERIKQNLRINKKFFDLI